MRWNKKLLSALLLVVMLFTTLLPGAAAAELSATYEKASFYDIATTAYSRMLMFQNGVTAAANAQNQYGLIDAAGNVKVDFQYSRLDATGGGYFIATKSHEATDQWGFSYTEEEQGIMDSTGKMVYPMGKNYISMQNKTICIYPSSGDAVYYTADMKPSTESAYYGESTDSGIQVAGYDWVTELAPGYYEGYSWENGSALLDSSFKVVVPAGQYDYLRLLGVSNGMPYIAGEKYDSNQSCVIDGTGKVIIPMGSYSYIGGVSPNGKIAVSTWTMDNNGNPTSCVSKLYDLTGKEIKTWNDREVTTETYFRDLAFTLDGEKYGTMDETGKVVIPNQFDTLTSANDLTKVIVGNQSTEDEWSYIWGMYTADGQKILDAKYTELKILGDGYFRACDGTHYGIADGSGKFVVPLSYSQLRVYCRDFIEAVDDNGGSKVINVKNEEIIPQSLEELYVYNDYNDFDYNSGWYNALMSSYDGYEGYVLPFRVKTASGYSTYYVDYTTGESLGSLPVLASNITSDGRFVYRDNATGLYGFGRLDQGSFANPDAPSSTNAPKVAYATTYSILVDGKPVEFKAYALKDEKGNDTNYLKVRDVAYILNGSQAQFNVDWDGAAGSIVLQTKTPYTTANGSEMAATFSGNQPYQSNPATVLVDGEKTSFDAITLTDSSNSGHTYFKVRDLGKYLGFEVTWDSAKGAIVIDTTKPYSGT